MFAHAVVEQAYGQIKGWPYSKAHDKAADAEGYVEGYYRHHSVVRDGDLFIIYRTTERPFVYTTTIVDFEGGNVVSVTSRPSTEGEKKRYGGRR